MPHRIGVQIARRLGKFETMRMRQRQHDVVFRRRGLQFEIKGAAKTLTQRQTPRPVDAAAEWRMNNELHAAGFIEKPLEHDRVQGRQRAERRLAGTQVLHDLKRGGLIEPHRFLKPGKRRRRLLPKAPLNLLAQIRDRRREFHAAARRLSQPEGNRGRLTVRILDAHRAPFDTQNSVRRVAELEDIALQAFHGEVFVHRADHDGFRFEHHAVIGIVRDGAAGGDRGEPGALARPQHFIDGIVMQQCAAAAAPRAEPFRQHLHALVEFFALQVAVRIRAAHQREQRILRPFARRHFRGHLLRQHIESVFRDLEPVELAAPDRLEQRCALDQFVARQREEPAFGDAADGVPRSPHSLQERVDGTGRAYLTHQVHIADVDAEFQRGRGHQHLEIAAFQALFGIQAALLR